MNKAMFFRKVLDIITRKNERGFTLVELMIVVAIIATLAAIGIPQFLKRLDKGRSAETSTFFRHIMDQEKKFASLNNAKFYPTSATSQTDEAKLAKALNLELGDSQNFCYEVTKVDNTTTPKKILLTAIVRTSGSDPCTANRDADEETWANTRDSTKTKIVFQYPSPTANDTNSEAGWEGNVNMDNFINGGTAPTDFAS